jgi:hypothetical protein
MGVNLRGARMSFLPVPAAMPYFGLVVVRINNFLTDSNNYFKHLF